MSSDAPTLTSAFRTALAGRYVVEREVGSGGMAVVYSAANGWDIDIDGPTKRLVFGADAGNNGGPARLVITLNALGNR